MHARCLGSVQGLHVGDLVLPADTKEGTKDTHMELLQLLEMPAVQRSGLAPTEEKCEKNGSVDLELCEES